MLNQSKGAALYCTFVLVIIACVARVIYLDSDPYFANWIGYVTDEGRWSETARNLALFGTTDASQIARLHLLLSPGYQAADFILFKLLGVHFWSARLFAAFCGALIVVTAYVMFHRRAIPFALALGALILGFEPNMFSESRVGLPELPAAFASLLAFVTLIVAKQTYRNAFAAGLIGAVAISMKATNLPIIIIFAVMICCVPGPESLRMRMKRCVAFMAGATMFIVAGVIAAVAMGLIGATAIADGSGRILEFLSLADPYSIVMRFFDMPEMAVLNVLLAGMWFCSWMWIAKDKHGRSVADTLYVGSGIWAAGWLIVWSGNAYLPSRYVVHFIVPATINIIAGLSLAGGAGAADIATVLRGRRGVARAALLLWLTLPFAIVIAPAALGFAELAGWDMSRMLARFGVIAVLTIVSVTAMWRRELEEVQIMALLALPILLVLIWLGGRELGVFHFWWKFETGAAVTAYTALAVLCFGVYSALASRFRFSQLRNALQVCVLGLTVATVGAQTARAIIAPSYSIRDASRSFEHTLVAAKRIRSLSAASLFLETSLSYRELTRDDNRFDCVVVFEHGHLARPLVASGRFAGFVRVQAFALHGYPDHGPLAEENAPVIIAAYMRSGDGD